MRVQKQRAADAGKIDGYRYEETEVILFPRVRACGIHVSAILPWGTRSLSDSRQKMAWMALVLSLSTRFRDYGDFGLAWRYACYCSFGMLPLSCSYLRRNPADAL